MRGRASTHGDELRNLQLAQRATGEPQDAPQCGRPDERPHEERREHEGPRREREALQHAEERQHAEAPQGDEPERERRFKRRVSLAQFSLSRYLRLDSDQQHGHEQHELHVSLFSFFLLGQNQTRQTC
jgi:hypothetical protein